MRADQGDFPPLQSSGTCDSDNSEQLLRRATRIHKPWFNPKAKDLETAAEPQLTRTPFRNNCGMERRQTARLLHALKVATGTPAEKPIRAALMCSRDFIVLENTLIGRTGHAFVPFACHKKFCARCARADSETLQQRLLPLAANAGAKRLRHLVLTIHNAPAGGLEGRLDDLKHCFREWRNQGRRKAHGEFWRDQSGYHSKLEITYSRRAGWHPHLHVLMDCARGYDHTANSDSRRAWERITANRIGSPAIASFITKPETAGIAREVAKYTTKPLEVASAGTAALCEAAAALHKRRVYASQGTLHAEIEEESGSGYAYLDRLSSIVTMPQRAAENGVDVANVLADFRARYARDPAIAERIPALRAILAQDDEDTP